MQKINSFFCAQCTNTTISFHNLKTGGFVTWWMQEKPTFLGPKIRESQVGQVVRSLSALRNALPARNAFYWLWEKRHKSTRSRMLRIPFLYSFGPGLSSVHWYVIFSMTRMSCIMTVQYRAYGTTHPTSLK